MVVGGKGRKDEADQGSSRGSFLAVSALITVLCAAFLALTISMQRPGCYRRPYNSTPLGKLNPRSAFPLPTLFANFLRQLLQN